MKDFTFTELQGLTITEIEGLDTGSAQIRIHTKEGRSFLMHHVQDCCEDVHVDSVSCSGPVIGEPIIDAIEHTNTGVSGSESFTNTWYTIRTQSATMVIRWYGRSNGHYSERVDFVEIT